MNLDPHLLARLDDIDGKLTSILSGHHTHPAPITTKQLITRWNVSGKTPKHQLTNLRLLCADRRLKPMRGQKGADATYDYAQVLRAEENA